MGASETDPSTKLEISIQVLARCQRHQLFCGTDTIQRHLSGICGAGLADMFGMDEQTHNEPGEGRERRVSGHRRPHRDEESGTDSS